MSKILVVGNVVKDVYLNLDSEQNAFEEDEAGVNWLDLSFDGSKHNFFRRTAVFAGARVTREVLESFHHHVKIAAEDKIAADYRYILCKDDQITYLSPAIRRPTAWQAPTETYDWIYVDRSATLSMELVQNIQSYMAISPRTRLAYYAHSNMNGTEESLARIATLVFADDNLRKADIPQYRGLFCHISMNNIVLEGIEQSWKQTRARTDLMTHLTIYSIIAGTVFAALTDGRNVKDSLLLAKMSIENAALNEVLPPEKLDRLVMEYQKDLMNLRLIASSAVSKGILAADESGGSIHKKFEQAGIPDDEAHRRDYRNIFFTTDGLEKYVSGVILFNETARQRADDGSTFTEFLTRKGIIPGIKVDQGLVNFPDSEEKYTCGLDGLPERLAEYHEMGLRFAKWRAAFEVVPPSERAIQKNCEILAQYAKNCQDALIVPIVEPEVVHDGNYSIETCAEVTGKILDELFRQLAAKRVDLAACILKCNMVLAGKQYPEQSSPEEVGQRTAAVLRAHVPAELAGVVFLSGGQGVEQATDNLQQVTNNGPFPWPVTFSFARALQGPALDAWQGHNENANRAREAFHARLVANADALKKH
ncbi:fructose-bisphosphate aldolase class I [Candidatus Saccharibacteria bacterium]|nr:fructose-bisphosphate aldolase class I [Candidatus Saccharibacteria bacterium]